MNIRLVFFIILMLACSILQAQQQKNITYRQQIDGTKVSFEMQPIPAGVFLMGSEKGKADELPVHKVKLSAFWMSKVEVTWDIFELFLYKDYEKTNSTKISDQVDAVSRPYSGLSVF